MLERENQTFYQMIQDTIRCNVWVEKRRSADTWAQVCGLTLQPLVSSKRRDLPRLCTPPSSWLRGVSLWRGEACERRKGARQEGGGEQGSEGGATTRRWEWSETQEVGVVCVVQEGGAPWWIEYSKAKVIPRKKIIKTHPRNTNITRRKIRKI